MKIHSWAHKAFDSKIVSVKLLQAFPKLINTGHGGHYGYGGHRSRRSQTGYGSHGGYGGVLKVSLKFGLVIDFNSIFLM